MTSEMRELVDRVLKATVDPDLPTTENWTSSEVDSGLQPSRQLPVESTAILKAYDEVRRRVEAFNVNQMTIRNETEIRL